MPPKPERQPKNQQVSVSLEHKSERITDELATAIAYWIVVCLYEHGDDLAGFTEAIRTELDVATNDAVQYRSRRNWHVATSRFYFVHSVVSDRYMVFHVAQPSREPLHVLVFYA